MKSVYKYILKAEAYQTIIMTVGAKILSTEEQYGQIVVYALVDKLIKGIEEVGIIILGTGHEVTNESLDDYVFLNTVKLENGNLMFHVFYKQSEI